MLLMVELLTLIATLAIIMVGIAVVLQITSIEEIFRFIGRAVAVVTLMLVVLCVLKAFWIGVISPWLSAAFESVKTLMGWLLVIIVSLIVLSFVGRLALSLFVRHLTLRRDPQTGDGYGINDSKDAKN